MPEVESILFSEEETKPKARKVTKHKSSSPIVTHDNLNRPTKNRNFFMSLRNAWNGIIIGEKESSHVRFHMFAGVFVLMISMFLHLTAVEWALVIFLIFTIISAELFNSAIEDICNLLRDKAGVDYAFTGKSKDIGSGAVLVLAIMSIAVFIIIYVPKLVTLFALMRI